MDTGRLPTTTRTLTTLLALALAIALAAMAVGPTGAAAAKKKPRERNLEATFTTTITAAPGQDVPTTQMITMWVPKGIRIAGEKMPFCRPEVIAARGTIACPAKSKVGKGTAKGWVFETVEPMFVELYNGPKNTLLAQVRGYNPVSIDATIQSRVSKPKGGKYGYGMMLEFPFPENLIHPVPGATASLLTMTSTLSGRVGFLRSTSCPPEGWSMGALLTNVGGGGTEIQADLGCRK